MADTKIDWADKVWNPVTGCTKVSAGCKNCYAERIAKRFWGERKFGDVVCHADRLGIPLRWTKPAKIFVNSMSDLFHPNVPDIFIGWVFSTMIRVPQHKFIILTKRPKRMFELLKHPTGEFAESILVNTYRHGLYPDITQPLPNVWLGVSVENQKAADERIPYLLQTPAAVRFVSVEPMLEQINISNGLNGYPEAVGYLDDLDDYEWVQTKPPLDWVICGSESGQGSRPFDIDWARSLKDQCASAGVPFFLKQMTIDGKLVKMPELDGKVWAEYAKE